MEQELTQQKINQYDHYSHSVGLMMMHLEWKPKYAYKMFKKEEQKNLITACIRRAATMHKIKIVELNVQPEHVHCVVGISLTMSPGQALQILKGVSSRLFFLHHEKAGLRYPRHHLWSPGKFAASIGFIQIEKACSYVRNQ